MQTADSEGALPLRGNADGRPVTGLGDSPLTSPRSVGQAPNVAPASPASGSGLRRLPTGSPNAESGAIRLRRSARRVSPDVADMWEKRLRLEGLGTVDNGDGTVSSERHGKEPATAQLDAARTAVETWTAWATLVLRKVRLTNIERSVWTCYSKGETLNEIAGANDMTKQAVWKAITRVKDKSPSPPCPNPWSNRPEPAASGDERDMRAMLMTADKSLTAKVAILAIANCDRDKLRRAFEGDPKLARLLPQEWSLPMETEKKPAPARPVRYARIDLKEEIDVKQIASGNGAARKICLADVDGRPHSLGIDVAFDCLDPYTQKPYTRVITIPHWKIKQADRIIEKDA